MKLLLRDLYLLLNNVIKQRMLIGNLQRVEKAVVKELKEIQLDVAKRLGVHGNLEEELETTDNQEILKLVKALTSENIKLDNTDAFSDYAHHADAIKNKIFRLTVSTTTKFFGFTVSKSPLCDSLNQLLDTLIKNNKMYQDMPQSSKPNKDLKMLESRLMNRLQQMESETKELQKAQEKNAEELKKAQQEAEVAKQQVVAYKEGGKQLARQLLSFNFQGKEDIQFFFKKMVETGLLQANEVPPIPTGTTTSSSTPDNKYKWKRLSEKDVSSLNQSNKAHYHRYQLGKYLTPSAKYPAMVYLVEEFIKPISATNGPSTFNSIGLHTQTNGYSPAAKEYIKNLLFKFFENYDKPWATLCNTFNQNCPSDLKSELQDTIDFFATLKEDQGELSGIIKGRPKANAYQMFNTAYAQAVYLPQHKEAANFFFQQAQELKQESSSAGFDHKS